MNQTQRLDDIPTLSGSAILSGLSLDDIGGLLGHLEIVSVAAPGLLAREGEHGDGLLFILEGRARAARSEGGLSDLSPGAFFGELTLVGDGRHTATVNALSPMRLARLTPRGFDLLGRSRPATALHLATALLAHAGGELLRRSRRPAPAGTRVRDLVPREVDGALVVAAMLDHLAVPLDAPAVAGATVVPMTTRNWEGREIYRRTAGLVLLEAAHRSGIGRIQIGPSLTSGRIVLVEGHPDLPALCPILNAAIDDLVRQDAPVREELWKIEAAIAHFVKEGWEDAAALLAFWHDPMVSLARCGEVVVLAPGPMLPSAGMLRGIEVHLHPGGLVLDFGPVIRTELPRLPHSTRALELRAPRYGADMTQREREWLALLGVTSVGRFNRACVSGQVKDFIHVGEGFHEKRIALIADEVKARGDVRIIAVAGPSSSGKTTFIKRLKVQLEVDGMHAVELSLDDYYLDRERSPRDASGAHDFEALEALDLALLDEHIRRLLGGERVRTARYDFLTGKSHPGGGSEIQLGAGDVLLVEGIHGLNPALLGEEASRRAFRIFIHPATALPFDRLSTFEPADVRLLRRIVRDRHQRGCPAADNLARWPSVRRGERIHIFPHQPNADAVFDSSLVYEISVLRVYAERYLLEVPRDHPEFSAAYRLRRLMSAFVPVHPDHVPPTSILREFIGGGGFTY